MIIFDVDDTLLYTVKNVYIKTNLTLEYMNLSTISWNHFIDIYKYNHFLIYIEKLNLWNDKNKFLSTYKAFWKNIPYSSICDLNKLLHAFSEEWYDLWIITNGPWSITYKKLLYFDINPFLFSFILHSDNSHYLKPNNKIFNEILNNRIDEYNNVFYIWDSIIDYESTYDTLVNFVAVTTWLYSKEDFFNLNLCEDNIIENVTCLKDFLNSF